MKKYCWWPKDKCLSEEMQTLIEGAGILNGALINTENKETIDYCVSQLVDIQLKLILLRCPPEHIPMIWTSRDGG